MRENGAPSKIGVVVIGRNEGLRLVGCLVSLEASEKDLQVVYVDSGSSDGSIAAAERVGASVVPLDMTLPFTAARARNQGFAALKAWHPEIDYVQFIDGDCELQAGWLDVGLEFLDQHKEVAIVCGRRRERCSDQSVYNLLCDIEWNTPVGKAAACGGDSLVRVVPFETVGGFRDQLIAGEEPELCLRMREAGWSIWRVDAEMTMHDADMRTFASWWRRNVRNGYATAEICWIHRKSAFGIWRREIASTIIWATLLPMTLILIMGGYSIAVIGTLIYPLQIVRMALRKQKDLDSPWTYALYTMVAHFALFRGIMTFAWRCWRRAPIELIEYKNLA